MATQAAVLEAVEPLSNTVEDHDPWGPRLPRVEVTLLGGFAVRLDGRPISSSHWARRQSAALVKVLALAQGRSLHREQVIDALWPDLSVEDAAPRLHKAAHYARRALGFRAALVLSAETVRLCPDTDVRVDVVRFEQRARSAVEAGGIAPAKGALAVYNGTLLPHDLYQPWTERHRLHLRRLHLAMLHQAQDWHTAISAEPSDETAYLALTEQYLDSGDRPAALGLLDRLEAMVHEELALEPSTRARELRRQAVVTPRGMSRTVDVRDQSAAAQSAECVEPNPQCCTRKP